MTTFKVLVFRKKIDDISELIDVRHFQAESKEDILIYLKEDYNNDPELSVVVVEVDDLDSVVLTNHGE